MADNMDMYLKHIANWAQKEKAAGFRSLPVDQPEAAPQPKEDTDEDE